MDLRATGRMGQAALCLRKYPEFRIHVKTLGAKCGSGVGPAFILGGRSVSSSPRARNGVADGTVPPVGNTVDVTTATYTNDIGDTELAVVWTDPDFDPTLRAAYYVRVLEIPTPRRSTYDAARNNLPLPTIVPATIQEQAWSSPIWYTPPAK